MYFYISINMVFLPLRAWHSCVFDMHSTENLDQAMVSFVVAHISRNIINLDFDFQI